MIGISDWLASDTYRTKVTELKNRIAPNTTTWTIGYWSWQWYSKETGMKPYIPGKTLVKANDYFIIPVNIAPKKVVDITNLKLTEELTINSNFITFFSGSAIPGLYSSDYANPPWKLSKSPIDTIRIYQVKKTFR